MGDIHKFIALTFMLGMVGLILGIFVPHVAIPAALLWSGGVIAAAIIAQRPAP